MPGLGYLPYSCDVVSAIQAPLFMEKLGPQAEADPVKALTDLGLPEIAVDAIESASGVGLKEVDQLVVGIGLERSLPPQLVIVVTTRKPYDLTALRRRTKANPLKKDGRTLYVAKAGHGLNIYWWRRTIAF